MVLCQFFLNGNCRYGPKCNNEHLDLKHIIRAEIDSAIKGNQWPISCFGPFKDKPCIPNFIEDQSFEEIRYNFYQAKVNDNFEQVRNGFINMIQESKTKLQQLNTLSPEIMNMFIQLYNSHSEQKDGNPAGQATKAANVFAAANLNNSQTAAQAQNIFSKSSFATTPDASAANIFGGVSTQNQQPSTNIFGGGSFTALNQSPGVFGVGQVQQQPQQSIFSTQTQPNIGAFAQPTQGLNPNSPFSLPQVGSPQASQNIFGPPQPTQGAFSAPVQTQSAPNNIFGGQTTFQQQNQPIQSVFAAPANQSPFGGGQQSIFAQQQPPQQPNSVNIFQTQQQQSPQPASVFGQAPQPDSNAVQMRNNVFNQARQPSQQMQSNFGPVLNNQSPFQQPLPHLQQQQQTPPFAQQQQVPNQPSVQNQPPTGGYYDLCYSKLSDLTKEELEAFKSDHFEIGNIPTVPPPKELCF